jgi:hypothetical protein
VKKEIKPPHWGGKLLKKYTIAQIGKKFPTSGHPAAKMNI